MASPLDIELQKLKNAIIKMGNLAESQVSESMRALISGPIPEAKKDVRKNEHKIDKLDVKIDDICQTVFALQQPVASDLRFIMSAMQISNEIERIGDLALSIIKKSKNISEKSLITSNSISEIASHVETITTKTNMCFQTLEENILGEIFLLDNSIRHKSNDAVHAIVSEMKTNSQTVVSGTNLIIILKHMERMAEHCTNIGEALYFMINAKTIKHEKFTEKPKDL